MLLMIPTEGTMVVAVQETIKADSRRCRVDRRWRVVARWYQAIDKVLLQAVTSLCPAKYGQL